MSEIVLNAEIRESIGKESSHKIRGAGNIPGILYGPEIEATPISVNIRELGGLIRREGRTNMLIDLNLGNAANGNDRKVIIRELQRDPVTGAIHHVDLYQVALDRKLNMMVSVDLVGMPAGVKDSGGILQQTRREIEISCLPADIPNRIKLDVAALEIGDSLHVNDIDLPGADIITDKKLTICTVVPPTVIKATTAEEEEAAALAEAEEAESEEAEGEEGEAKEGGEKGKKEKKEE